MCGRAYDFPSNALHSFPLRSLVAGLGIGLTRTNLKYARRVENNHHGNSSLLNNTVGVDLPTCLNWLLVGAIMPAYLYEILQIIEMT